MMDLLARYYSRVFYAESPIKAVKAYGKVQKYIGQETDLDEIYGPKTLYLIDKACRDKITHLMKAEGVQSDSSGYDSNDSDGIA